MKLFTRRNWLRSMSLALAVMTLATLIDLQGPAPATAQGMVGAQANFAGSFTATLATGFASAPTGTVQYRVNGGDRRVTLFAPVAITGTSNANPLTLTGLPFQVIPQQALTIPCMVTDNTVQVIASCNFASASGTVTFGMGAGFSATGFTTSGTKGLQAGWTVSYTLY